MRQDSTGAVSGPTFEQIRQRAYELWERNHQPMGFEIEFWLMAERELRAERGRSTKAKDVEEAKDFEQTKPTGAAHEAEDAMLGRQVPAARTTERTSARS